MTKNILNYIVWFLTNFWEIVGDIWGNSPLVLAWNNIEVPKSVVTEEYDEFVSSMFEQHIDHYIHAMDGNYHSHQLDEKCTNENE